MKIQLNDEQAKLIYDIWQYQFSLDLGCPQDTKNTCGYDKAYQCTGLEKQIDNVQETKELDLIYKSVSILDKVCTSYASTHEESKEKITDLMLKLRDAI